ncbi:hypothetical protein AYI68_g1809 [Smittium mucronatum]|uniref:Uncharacterized protein n=1 Tax=Smittium mucronatum TaxID=133383 RepID=A0A1R0H4K0_9FUNG|nr:hypothetical protein AYI68_g1809 [Smittium mucronatum]
MSCSSPVIILKDLTLEVEVWREVAKDRSSDALVSLSNEVTALGDDLDTSVDLAGKPVMEYLVSSLLKLSLSSSLKPSVHRATG